METDEHARISALIRFYYKENPDEISDEKYAKYFNEIIWVLKFIGSIHSKNG